MRMYRSYEAVKFVDLTSNTLEEFCASMLVEAVADLNISVKLQ